ncbi:condensation domain-containing protein [Sphaerisporangium fuscum]|uniref:condensation domain-containing protein n=1 Tax=Sphaerisporangium fuscum TaxID=2835868 RepID=UPI001BDD4942|nr:condensation domain-containing protein [Sphaerisporangium fuscum]
MTLTDRPAGELSPEQARLLEREVETALLQQDAVADCAVVFQGVGDEGAARLCVRCGITQKYPGIGFDAGGVCNLCQMYEGNRDAIHAYFGQPEDMVRRIRARAEASRSDYDCLLLFSGGKDSTYVLHQLVDLGLRVMTFTFDNGFISKTALRNVEEITGELGIEHVTMTRADQNKIFLLSLQQHKSVCNGCFRSLLDLSTELAHERGIPTIVTGLSRGQIIDERLSWFYQQGVFDPAEIEPKLAIGRKIYHQTGSDIDTAAVDAVEVVDYFRYSDVTKTGIREFLQRRSSFWSQPQDTGFCSSNCMINDVGVYVHNQERGYHNYEAPTRWEVRVGHLTVPEADEELRTPVDIPRVKRMLAKIGYADPADRDRLGSRLVAYYVARRPIDPDELRASVARAVPDILLPEQWVPVEEIPRSAGLVVREALAAPRPTRFGTDIGEEPAKAVPAPRPADPTVPLTPAQRAFFETWSGSPDLARRARALLLELPGGPDAARVKKITLQLMLHHDALRLRFLQRDGEWRQRDGGASGPLPVIGLDLSRHDPGVEPGLLRAAVDRLRARLDLTGGPVAQIALIDRGERPAWLLLVVHELIADTESWRVLLSDLLTARTQLAAGPVVTLPPAASFLAHAASGTPSPASASSGPAARDAVAAITSALTEALPGESLEVDVVDHTTRGDRPGDTRLIGQLTSPTTTAVTPPEAEAVVRVRYEHFGDLAALLPAGAPLTLAAREEADFTDLPGDGPYAVTVTGVVRDGRLRLEWRYGPEVRDRLPEETLPGLLPDAVGGAVRR